MMSIQKKVKNILDLLMVSSLDWVMIIVKIINLIMNILKKMIVMSSTHMMIL